MKVWLLSQEDWDGVWPISLHRDLDIARATAERLLREHHAELLASGKKIAKGFKAGWHEASPTYWQYGGYVVEQMEVQD